jgi:hypothetical protein
LRRSDKFVQTVLSNPMYCGDYVWNRNSRGRFAAIRDGRVVSDFEPGRNDEKDWVRIEGNHDAIVDRETFNRVQALRLERSDKTAPYRNGGTYLLTGLCRCVHCGQKFSNSYFAKDDRITVTCNGKKNGNCKRNSVNQEQILGAVIASMQEFAGKHLDELREEYIKGNEQERETLDLPALRREIQRRRDEYDDYRKKIKGLPEDLMADFAEDLRQMKSAISELESREEEAAIPVESVVERFDIQAEQLRSLVGNLGLAFERGAKVEPMLFRELLRSFIHEIRLDVGDHGVGRNPRFYLRFGEDSESEIKLKPRFNLLPVS